MAAVWTERAARASAGRPGGRDRRLRSCAAIAAGFRARPLSSWCRAAGRGRGCRRPRRVRRGTGAGAGIRRRADRGGECGARGRRPRRRGRVGRARAQRRARASGALARARAARISPGATAPAASEAFVARVAAGHGAMAKPIITSASRCRCSGSSPRRRARTSVRSRFARTSSPRISISACCSRSRA